MIENLEEIIGLVQKSPLLEEHQKQEFIDELTKGEPFSDEFIEEFGMFLMEQTALLNEEEQELLQKRVRAEEEVRQARKETYPKRKKLVLEHQQVVNNIVSHFEQEAKELSAQHDQKVEVIIREQGEQGQIDDIRASLGI